jgi:hypothetical protein
VLDHPAYPRLAGGGDELTHAFGAGPVVITPASGQPGGQADRERCGHRNQRVAAFECHVGDRVATDVDDLVTGCREPGGDPTTRCG